MSDMLIVAGTFTVDPGRRAEFLESRLEAIRTSRTEQGCVQYAMSADAVDPAVAAAVVPTGTGAVPRSRGEARVDTT